jgi:hypothetical protein
MNHYIISSKHTSYKAKPNLFKYLDEDFDIELQDIKHTMGKKNVNKIKKLIGFTPSEIYVNCEKNGLLPNGYSYTTKDMRSVYGRSIDMETFNSLPDITIPFYGRMIFVLRNSSYEKCNHEWKTNDITDIRTF